MCHTPQNMFFLWRSSTIKVSPNYFEIDVQIMHDSLFCKPHSCSFVCPCETVFLLIHVMCRPWQIFSFIQLNQFMTSRVSRPRVSCVCDLYIVKGATVSRRCKWLNIYFELPHTTCANACVHMRCSLLNMTTCHSIIH